MVLVDTSVWISLFRKENEEIGQKMWGLTAANQAAVCGQVWVEYIGGFRKESERKKHAKAFQAFPYLETTHKAYELGADLLGKYPQLGPGDAMIAATAITTGAPLFTTDHDFQALRKEGLVLF
jgi:predicted nucleic acid-binding protein